MKRLFLTTALVLIAASGGCEPAPIYGPDAKRQTIGSVTARSLWSASGNLDNPALAFDGNLGTAAVAQAGSNPPSLTIDLGQVCMFNFIAIDHGADQLGYARRVQIDTSIDGRTFTARIVGPGTRRVSDFLLQTPAHPNPVLARYVRITAVESGQRPWSVAEVYLQ